MIVGKRRCFEDEPLENQNAAYQLRRRITQEKQLETLNQARKRLIQANVYVIMEKYPTCNPIEISKLLEDFDNNIEMVLELLDSQIKTPQKIEITEQREYKSQITNELVNRLQQASNVQEAKETAHQFLSMFEQIHSRELEEKLQNKLNENKLLKSAFLKQNHRLEKQKVEIEMKESEYIQCVNALKAEIQELKQINNSLTVCLIQAQQQTIPNGQYHNDIF